MKVGKHTGTQPVREDQARQRQRARALMTFIHCLRVTTTI
jgi:hypothetical protein